MTQVIDFIGGEYRNRTGVHGFAIRCVTTPPTRRSLWSDRLLTDRLRRCKGCILLKMRCNRCRWTSDMAHLAQ